MNEELEKRLLKYLDALESSVKTAGDFAADQVPDVCQQFLAWEFWSCILFAAMAVGFAIAFAGMCVRWKRSAAWDAECAYSWGASLAFAGVVLSTVLAFVAVYHAVKVAVAPKVVLLEKVSTMIRAKR